MPDPTFSTRVAKLERTRHVRPFGFRHKGTGGPHHRWLILGRMLAALILAAIAFKTLLFVGLGETVYEARRERLAKGTELERAAAWIMQPDPITQGVNWLVEALQR